MRKIKILIILLLIVGCNKIEKIDTVETQDTLEQQPLSEEEAWKLFDEFWVEFQRAVAEGDEKAIREMNISDYGINNFIIFSDTFLKKYFETIEFEKFSYPEDNISWMPFTNHSDTEKFGLIIHFEKSFTDSFFKTIMGEFIDFRKIIFNRIKLTLYTLDNLLYLDFRLKDGKYKFYKFIMSGISNSAYY